MSNHHFQPDREPSQETDPMDVAGRRPSPFAVPAEPLSHSHRPVSALGWGLALAGGALGWAVLFGWMR